MSVGMFSASFRNDRTTETRMRPSVMGNTVQAKPRCFCGNGKIELVVSARQNLGHIVLAADLAPLITRITLPDRPVERVRDRPRTFRLYRRVKEIHLVDIPQ